MTASYIPFGDPATIREAEARRERRHARNDVMLGGAVAGYVAGSMMRQPAVPTVYVDAAEVEFRQAVIDDTRRLLAANADAAEARYELVKLQLKKAREEIEKYR